MDIKGKFSGIGFKKAAVQATGKPTEQDGSQSETASPHGFTSSLRAIHARVDSSPVEVSALINLYPIAERIFIDPVIKVMASGVNAQNHPKATMLDEMGFNATMMSAFLETLKRPGTGITVWEGKVLYGKPDETPGDTVYRFDIPTASKQVARLIAMSKEIVDQIYNFGITSNKTMFVVNHPDERGGGIDQLLQELMPQVKTLKEQSTLNNIGILAGGKIEVLSGSIDSPREALLVVQRELATSVGIPYSVLFETENVGGIGSNGEQGESYLRYQLKLRTIQRQILEPVYNCVLDELGIDAQSWQWNDPFAISEKQRGEALIAELQAAKLASEAYNIAVQSVGMGAEFGENHGSHLIEINEKIAKAFENNKNNH